MNIKLNIDGKEYEVVSKEQKKLPKTWEVATADDNHTKHIRND